MPGPRKYVMTIAGFDPSGGAGLLADIKTFEQHKVYGLSVNTANTLQTPEHFLDISWTGIDNILKTIDMLLSAYVVEVIKIGIVQSFTMLDEIIFFIKKKSPAIKIVIDPV